MTCVVAIHLKLDEIYYESVCEERIDRIILQTSLAPSLDHLIIRSFSFLSFRLFSFRNFDNSNKKQKLKIQNQATTSDVIFNFKILFKNYYMTSSILKKKTKQKTDKKLKKICK